MRNCFFVSLFACFFLIACNNNASNTTANDTATIDGHPAWIMQGNIYEVNVRQYTPEGTFKAFEEHLERLNKMGVQTLWFMPVNPISKAGRKGALGSYYAVSDFTAINPEFGTLDDWKHLVNKAHDMGFKVIIDWVPNHTGADHVWLTSHPDFYVKDSSGKAALPDPAWTDVRQLDFKNTVMQDSMIAAMKYWITQTGIDGYRCDHVEEFQKDFWKRCIPELKKLKNILMLAEAEKGWTYDAGFDMDYGWNLFHMMVAVAQAKKPALFIDSTLKQIDTSHNEKMLQLYFTSNHDENSWNKADYGTMPGSSHAPFAVLTQTIKRSVPLIYSGQEEPVSDSLSFFYKDTIHFVNLQRANFYKTLLLLRKNNPALSASASFKRLRTSKDDAIYAFEREKEGNKVFIIVNLSKTPQTFTFGDIPSEKEWLNEFSGSLEKLNETISIEPWGFVVYEKRKQ